MATPIYPWQQPVWDSLHALRQNMPHAILLHGQAGIGKRDFATLFAQSMLCENPLTQGMPCTACNPCGWFDQYSHPDFRRVRPENLEDGDTSLQDATNDQGEESGAADNKKTAKSSKAPSREIRIEQIRALAGFMNISTHRNCKRVVLLYPAESLNHASANALLKTLEEPPAETMILLVSNRVDRLLPTILSRCRKVAMPVPAREQSLAWLASQKVTDADAWLDEQSGAPLAALEQFQAGSRQELDDFLQVLARPSREGALALAEKTQKTHLSTLVSWLQRWLYDLSSYKLSGRIRYYPRYRSQLSALAAKVPVAALITGAATVSQRRAIAEHPLSPKLFIEDMLLDYVNIFS